MLRKVDRSVGTNSDVRRKAMFKLIRASGLLAIGMVAGTALAQQAPPTENKGVSASPLSAFDLSKQGLKDYDQRQMRIRQLKIEPGGVAAMHSHAQRPAFT